MALKPSDRAYHEFVLSKVQAMPYAEREPWLLRHLVRIPFPRDAISKRNATPLEAMDHILHTQEWRFVCFRQHTALEAGALQQTPWFSYAPIVDVSLVPVPSSEKEAPVCIQVRIHNSNHAQASKWKRLDMQYCESKCTHVNCQMACRESTAFLVPKRERSYALQVFQLERRLYHRMLDDVQQLARDKRLYARTAELFALKSHKQRLAAFPELEAEACRIEQEVRILAIRHAQEVFLSYLIAQKAAERAGKPLLDVEGILEAMLASQQVGNKTKRKKDEDREEVQDEYMDKLKDLGANVLDDRPTKRRKVRGS